MFVTALLPPGNITSFLQKIKNDLFVRFGYASVYALPPIIPVAITKEPVSVPASHSLIRQPEIIHTTATGISSGLIVMHISESTIAERIRSQILLPEEPAVSPFFSPVDAIILGVYEGTRSTDRGSNVIEYLEGYTVEPKRWKRSELVCFELLASSDPWWNACAVSYRWKRPLKSASP